MSVNITPEKSKDFLEYIIKTNEQFLKEEKKTLVTINTVSIIMYIVLIFIVKKVTMLNVISTAFLVASHYHFLMTSGSRTRDCKSEISQAKICLEIKEGMNWNE